MYYFKYLYYCRRVKPGTIVKDIKQGRPYALNLLKHAPYCIPFKTVNSHVMIIVILLTFTLQRIDIFMEKIKDDKSCLGLLDTGHRRPATYITIQRGRILEGGFEQLSSLPLIALKGTIRVKFVNEQVCNACYSCRSIHVVPHCCKL